MTFEERIAELERALEEERAFSKMRDLSYESDLERRAEQMTREAEERGYTRGIREAGVQAMTQKDFKDRLEHELNQKIPEMLKDAIPDEYKGILPRGLGMPRVKVDQYQRPDVMQTVTNVTVDIPPTRIMLSGTVNDEAFYM